MHVTGGCHCGAIAYEAEIDPERVSICHCTDCQRLTGTAYRVSTVARQEDFRLLRGTPKTYVKQGESGAYSRQFFCPDCGSHLYRMGEDTAFVGIRVGTINERAELPPRKQIWCRSALPWTGNIEALPRFETES
ncbi:Uncharacterized conserved protein [Rhizobium mongolense subsp. loessense]|uniref:Uncharacterized conserved protein n=1 Tax=Rhizobium mongolense subsp. loessense TaxID=158890 RepID=A0A1G4Q0B0_9HYPH|nr:GFA family protein [Rhizobium mongolense]SCW37758.1 Uncharacterized conserved protein [Rhizobium mongolense subsp. loessense]